MDAVYLSLIVRLEKVQSSQSCCSLSLSLSIAVYYTREKQYDQLPISNVNSHTSEGHLNFNRQSHYEKRIEIGMKFFAFRQWRVIALGFLLLSAELSNYRQLCLITSLRFVT